MIGYRRCGFTYPKSTRSLVKSEIAGALFMDVKGAFDHVSRAQLAQRMSDLSIDDDLIGWTQSFLADR